MDNITTLELIIAILAISTCVAVIVGVDVYRHLDKKYKIRIDEFKHDINCLQEVIHRLDVQYEEHIYRHH